MPSLISSLVGSVAIHFVTECNPFAHEPEPIRYECTYTTPQAQMLMHVDDMDSAERVLYEAIRIDAGFRDGLRQMALLYSFTNRTMEAEEWIRKALRLCPRGAVECASLHADYGDILKDMSNLNRSAEVRVFLLFYLSH